MLSHKIANKEAVHVRWLVRRDMESVLAIEGKCFEFPWSEEQFMSFLRTRNCIGMIAERESDEKLLGFMIYELHKTRLHLLNFAVHPDHRRQGIGAQLLVKLASKLRMSRSRIVLEVRETNLQAQQFFRAQGFRAVNVLRDFYEDTTEDAYKFYFGIERPSPLKTQW